MRHARELHLGLPLMKKQALRRLAEALAKGSLRESTVRNDQAGISPLLTKQIRLPRWRPGPQFAVIALSCRANSLGEFHLLQRSSNSGRPIQPLFKHRVAQPGCGFPCSRA
jgi:hypothetical protein